MRVLVGCEESGTVRNAMRELGHEAYSCDLQPDRNGSPFHYQMDVFEAIEMNGGFWWDLIIIHPPCTGLACSGNRYYGKGKPKHAERIEAIEWTMKLWDFANAHCEMVAMENPVGVIPIKPTQYIQPWQFGHGETKKTGLWLSGLVPLEPTNVVEGREQKCWRMPPGPTRKRDRSKTYSGIAKAMAEQWAGPS